MSLLKLRRWFPSEYRIGDHAITMEIRRPERSQVRALSRLVGKIGLGFDRTMKVTKDLNAAVKDKGDITQNGERLVSAQDELLSVLEDHEAEIARWFDRYVRNVGALEIDGEAVTTGKGLYEDADVGLVSYVIFRLHGLANLSDAEAKASASRSTSSPEPATDAGSSPATSTEREAGPVPSTATETLPVH